MDRQGGEGQPAWNDYGVSHVPTVESTLSMAIYEQVMRMTGSRAGARSVLVALLALSAALPAAATAQDLTDARRIEVARRLSEATVSVTLGRSGGSGFVVGDEKWVITNAHVVAGYRRVPVRIQFGDGNTLPGRVIAFDQRHDLAILEAVGEVPVQPLHLGDSDAVQVGQTVLAFGSPYGLAGTLTQGIVSARRDLPGIGGGAVRGLIQTDAEINPGNSGGPLVDAHGRVIGVNTAILSRSGGSQGIGFAVPVSYVRTLLGEVREDLANRRRLAQQRAQQAEQAGERPEPGDDAPRLRTPVWLGIYGDDFRARGYAGVRVRQVVRGGPAQQAGVLGAADPAPSFVDRLGIQWTGHIILAVDGRPVRSMEELQRLLTAKRPGQRATLTLTVGPGVVSGETVVQLQAPPSQVR